MVGLAEANVVSGRSIRCHRRRSHQFNNGARVNCTSDLTKFFPPHSAALSVCQLDEIYLSKRVSANRTFCKRCVCLRRPLHMVEISQYVPINTEPFPSFNFGAKIRYSRHRVYRRNICFMGNSSNIKHVFVVCLLLLP